MQCFDIVGDNALTTEQLTRVTTCVVNLFKDYIEFMESQEGMVI